MAEPLRVLVATPRSRGRVRLDRAGPSEGTDPPLRDLLAVEGPLWVGGGEPTLRPDLPALLEALGDRLLGLLTDGQALVKPEAFRPLLEAGLSRVRVPFHSARAEAHDWLEGRPGAQRRAWRALRVACEADLEVSAEVLLTRPTLLHLEATLGLLARLPLRRVVLRLLEGDAPGYPATAARVGLIAEPLQAGLETLRRAGCDVDFEGVPRCVVEGLAVRRTPRPVWVGVDVPEPPPRSTGCATCPADGSCPGPSSAYVAAFGRQELPRAPLESQPVVVRLREGLSTRHLRHLLVQVASSGARALRLEGLDHPHGAELLGEALALCFERVEVSGRLEAVAGWSDRDRLRLRRVDHVAARRLGPDAATHDARTGRVGSWEEAAALLRKLAAQGIPTSIQEDA